MALSRKRHLQFTRDTAMFVIGVGMIVNESFIAQTDRPNILYTGLALMGVSAYLAGTRIAEKP